MEIDVKEEEIKLICDEIFLLLRKTFEGYVEIDKLNAQEKTREDLKEVIEDYYRILNGEEV